MTTLERSVWRQRAIDDLVELNGDDPTETEQLADRELQRRWYDFRDRERRSMEADFEALRMERLAAQARARAEALNDALNARRFASPHGWKG